MTFTNRMDKYQKFIDNIGKKYLTLGQSKFNEPLLNHTTFRIGGPAKIFFEAKKTKDLVKAVFLAQKLKLPYFILGGGSNILVGDFGFKGLVIKNKTQEIKILGYKGEIRKRLSKVKQIYIQADSGVPVNRLVRFTLDQKLKGLENFLGLPGTIGGAIYTNAHNLKASDFFGDHLFEVSLLTPNSKVKKVSRKYFNFSYDKSKIQKTKEIVLSAVFCLKTGDKDRLWEKADRMMEYRLKTQPLGKLSAGCIFKNVKKSEAMSVPTPGFTVSAGFLIEAAGLKGKKIGGAKVSALHANFILNTGSAKAVDVIKLIQLIKKKVKEKFGVALEEEIEKIGDF